MPKKEFTFIFDINDNPFQVKNKRMKISGLRTLSVGCAFSPFLKNVRKTRNKDNPVMAENHQPEPKLIFSGSRINHRPAIPTSKKTESDNKYIIVPTKPIPPL